jgi:hypothetical protein
MPSILYTVKKGVFMTDTISHAASVLNISTGAVRTHMVRGDLIAYREEGQWVIPESELKVFSIRFADADESLRRYLSQPFYYAEEPHRIDEYPPYVPSGGGLVYHSILAFRNWALNVHGEMTMYPSASYEDAQQIRMALEKDQATWKEVHTVALVQQKEYIDLLSDGRAEHRNEHRLCEWDIASLASGPVLVGEIPSLLHNEHFIKTGEFHGEP